MLQSSKLSSRFKKSEKTGVRLPLKLSFSSKNQEDKNEDLVEDVASEAESNFQAPVDILRVGGYLKQLLFEKVNSIPVWFEYSEEKQKELILNFIDNNLSEKNITVSDEERKDLLNSLYLSVVGFGPLEHLLSQDNVAAIFINGSTPVHIEIGGKILNTEMLLTEKQLDFVLSCIENLSGSKIDRTEKIWKAQVENLAISVILPSISKSGINIVIRKKCKPDIDFILNNSMLSKEVFDFLLNAVHTKKKILFSGESNSGKTTLLNVLINSSSLLNKRVVLLEKTSQICVDSPTLILLNVNEKDVKQAEFTDSILNLEPEYIVSDLNIPIIDFSEKEGFISTLRSSNVDGAISKLVNEYVVNECLPEKLAKSLVLNNYDYIVQLNKLKDGRRCVTSIAELTPARTTALSVKIISKLVDGKYINDFPQPLTSIIAESLISQSGSMSSRFCRG